MVDFVFIIPSTVLTISVKLSTEHELLGECMLCFSIGVVLALVYVLLGKYGHPALDFFYYYIFVQILQKPCEYSLKFLLLLSLFSLGMFVYVAHL